VYLKVAFRCLVILGAGLASYRLSKTMWALELSALHAGRGAALDSCVYPWSAVDVSKAFAAEFLGKLKHLNL